MLAGWYDIVHGNATHSENISIRIRISSSFSNINSNLFPSSREKKIQWKGSIERCHDMINQKKNITDSRYDTKKFRYSMTWTHTHTHIYIHHEISFQKFILQRERINRTAEYYQAVPYSYLYTQPENIFSLKPKAVHAERKLGQSGEIRANCLTACKNLIFSPSRSSRLSYVTV